MKVVHLIWLSLAVLASSVLYAQDSATEPTGEEQPAAVEETSESAESKPTSDDSEKADVQSEPSTNQLLEELLRRLQQSNLRDPFAPDSAIDDEKKRANNEFVAVGPGVEVPEITLVGVISIANKTKPNSDTDAEASEIKVASIKVEGKVYFVRQKDRLTLSRSKGNLVMEIEAINDGFVEVKLGTLSESVIIR